MVKPAGRIAIGLLLAMIPLRSFGLDVGAMAPPFTRPSTDGIIRLADFLGKKNVVLAFYEADVTGDLQIFQRDIEEFEGRNAQIVGVSGDDLMTHEKFRREFGITFPLVSDEEGVVANQYSGTARATYIIDRRGIVVFILMGVPDNRLLLEKLREIEE